MYLKQTNRHYKKLGLVIHPKYPYQASPDRLLDNEGIIGIKCPFKAKDFDPDHFKFNFLNKHGTEILESQIYYYQIQETLEITNRLWCDLDLYKRKHQHCTC